MNLFYCLDGGKPKCIPNLTLVECWEHMSKQKVTHWRRWFTIRDGDQFISYDSGTPTGFPVGYSYSDINLLRQWLNLIEPKEQTND